MPAILIVLITLLAPSGAAAQSGSAKYRFTTLLDSQDGLVPTRCAAINGLGTVAVQVEDTVLGFNKLITKRGADDAPVVVAHTERVAQLSDLLRQRLHPDHVEPLDQRAGRSGLPGQSAPARRPRPHAELPQQRDTPRQGVFLGTGGPLTTIAHTNNPPGSNFISEFVVADISVNSFGKVALAIELRGEPLFDQGLFVGSKTRDLRREVPQFHERVRHPLIAHVAQRGRPDRVPGQRDRAVQSRRHLQTDRRQQLRRPCRVRPLAEHLRPRGVHGFTFSAITQVQGVFTSRGGPVTTVADSTGPVLLVREPSLNDLGQVVFTADLDEFGPNGFPLQGVFTGPDPVNGQGAADGRHLRRRAGVERLHVQRGA